MKLSTRRANRWEMIYIDQPFMILLDWSPYPSSSTFDPLLGHLPMVSPLSQSVHNSVDSSTTNTRLFHRSSVSPLQCRRATNASLRWSPGVGGRLLCDSIDMVWGWPRSDSHVDGYTLFKQDRCP
ncbi:hypothetical protein ARMSODRAFT_104725 [Armillaria solidipes]|uniref:Uncharacterized protein n=1 Tax=Armillaria solidipes TaxID=1076256 RepID=A0A2H3APF6_9AGAR|nr:hypothetical protein ARMSODRAFT_104725 [Armillaria solidipes]